STAAAALRSGAGAQRAERGVYRGQGVEGGATTAAHRPVHPRTAAHAVRAFLLDALRACASKRFSAPERSAERSRSARRAVRRTLFRPRIRGPARPRTAAAAD